MDKRLHPFSHHGSQNAAWNFQRLSCIISSCFQLPQAQWKCSCELHGCSTNVSCWEVRSSEQYSVCLSAGKRALWLATLLKGLVGADGCDSLSCFSLNGWGDSTPHVVVEVLASRCLRPGDVYGVRAIQLAWDTDGSSLGLSSASWWSWGWGGSVVSRALGQGGERASLGHGAGGKAWTRFLS